MAEWQPSERSREHWLEQAALADEYANSRQASDISGYVAAAFDARAFRDLAAAAALAATP